MFKIFVGNLTPNVRVEDLHALFSKHAVVADIAMPADPQTGKLRGFAIVMIKDESQGKAAIMGLRGASLFGKRLVINQARAKGEKKPEKPARRGGPGFRARASGGRGGGGGGYGSGGGSGRPGYGNRGFRAGSGSRERSSDRDRDGDRGRDRRDDRSGPSSGSGRSSSI